MVPYSGENGNGLAISVFTGAGESAGRDFFSSHLGHDDVVCIAGKSLGDE